MTAAERLKQELKDRCPVTKADFIKAVLDGIKEYGRADFICDDHITQTSIRKGYHAICLQDEQVLTEYACSEGFRVGVHHNIYGVRELRFSL